MQFKDLLRLEGISPSDVNIILHYPREPEFAKVLPTLIHTRRAALDMYQAIHSRPAEQALRRGRPWAAVFVRIGPAAAPQAKMVFAGLYANHGAQDRTWGQILAEPEAQLLLKDYGIFRAESAGDLMRLQPFFDLRLAQPLKELVGRLVIRVMLTQTYVRLAEALPDTVLAIFEEGVAETPPPDWRKLTVTAAFLRTIPASWANQLAQWRGIYLIVDESDGARYVGSAFGTENLHGRWQAHVAREVGVTAQLRLRDPVNFRFSILERVSPDMPKDGVERLEQTWMTRLHTRTFGLN